MGKGNGRVILMGTAKNLLPSAILSNLVISITETKQLTINI